MCLAKYVKLSQMWLQLKPQPKKGDVRITDFHFKDSHNQAWVNRESDCGSVFARFYTQIFIFHPALQWMEKQNTPSPPLKNLHV